MWWALVAALVAAIAYGVASVLQGVAAQASPSAATGVDPRLVALVFLRWQFLLGIGFDLVGFIAQLIALRELPLFVVQAALAGSLAVTAVAARLFGSVLGGREWAAVGAVCAGLALLGASAAAEGANAVGPGFRIALVLAVVVLAGLGTVAGRLPGNGGASALGLVAGLGYGVVAVSGRVVEDFSPAHLLADPAAYALLGAAAVAVVFYTSALQRGRVTTATSAMVIGETVLPALVGVVALGDRTRPGFAVVAVLGFAVATVAATALARFGEPQVAAPAEVEAERHD